jgi:two-component system sensor histidine kinase/response regulator
MRARVRPRTDPSTVVWAAAALAVSVAGWVVAARMANPLPAAAGGALGIALVVMMARRSADEALGERERRLRAIIETSPECIKIIDAKGTLLDMNPAGLAIIEAPSLDAVVGGCAYDLVVPEHRDAYRALNESVCRGTPGSLEFEVAGLSGRRRWMETRAVPLRDDAGGRIVQLGLTRDVTDRRRAEETRARLAAIVESSGDAIIGVTVDGVVTSWNRGAERLYGWTEEEITGGREATIVPSERREELSAILARIRRGEALENYETVRLNKSGARVPVAFTVSPIRDGTGRVVAASTIARDITGRKETEREMERAREAALETARLKSEFLANMSHEIRTPMNGIVGMTELVLDSELSADQRENVETIRSSTEALLAIINDILDFSKIEAGKMEIEAIPFDPRGTLQEALRPLALQAHKKGLELAFDIQELVPEAVIGDPGRLRQVLVNLVGNAIKFTEAGTVTVKITRLAGDRDLVELHFEVIDTGIGIPADKQNIIFDPFSQADGSTTRKYGGTGLGLAIVTQLVEMMGGRLWVESEEGKGSTFHFTLSLSSARHEDLRELPVRPECLRDLDVLVVDDNATNRKILVEMVRAWGARPQAASGGREALEMIEAARQAGAPFPLVLLDVQMPGMNGFETAEAILTRPELARTSILLLTSSGQRGDAALCRRIGVAGYLSKPIVPEELMHAALAIVDVPEDAERALVTRHTLRDGVPHLRVLLAEDNAINSTVVTRLLEKRGHEVVPVGDGRDALAHLKQERFDVALLDVQMPGLDGLEVTARVRARESASESGHLPIIALTARALTGDRERCLAAGMDAYLAKPIDARGLFQALDHLIPARPGRRPAAVGTTQSRGVLDREAILARTEGDAELLAEIAEIFIRDSRALLDTIRGAVARADSAELERAAHRLKGGLGTLGAKTAADIAQRLESLGREGRSAEGGPSAVALATELARLEPELIALAGRAALT